MIKYKCTGYGIIFNPKTNKEMVNFNKVKVYETVDIFEIQILKSSGQVLQQNEQIIGNDDTEKQSNDNHVDTLQQDQIPDVIPEPGTMVDISQNNTDEKKVLCEKLDILGIEYDGRYGIEKLQELLDLAMNNQG